MVKTEYFVDFSNDLNKMVINAFVGETLRHLIHQCKRFQAESPHSVFIIRLPGLIDPAGPVIHLRSFRASIRYNLTFSFVLSVVTT